MITPTIDPKLNPVVNPANHPRRNPSIPRAKEKKNIKWSKPKIKPVFLLNLSGVFLSSILIMSGFFKETLNLLAVLYCTGQHKTPPYFTQPDVEHDSLLY